MGAILLGIGMFMFLVVIHELGHFTAAKKTGVHVHEFGVGIPPKVTKLRKDKAGTEYTINWIPLGGFVRLKGEDPDDEEAFLAKDSFITASLPHKLIILIGGVAVNTVFARFAFSLTFFMGVQPLTIIPESSMSWTSRSYLMPSQTFLIEKGFLDGKTETLDAIVGGVQDGSLASTIGINAGDVVKTVNKKAVTAHNISTVLQTVIGKDLVIDVERNGELLSFSGKCESDGCFLGIQLDNSGFTFPTIKFGLIDAMKAGVHEVSAQSKLTMVALGNLGSNLISFDGEKIQGSVNKLSGPVGIVMFGNRVLDQGGIKLYLAFAGVISLALALFNILPIPALDGGRIVGVLIQHFGRFSPQKYFVIENRINIFFFVMLMILGIWIIFVDLNRIPGISIPFIG